jgi:hypothetical protein
MRRKECKNYKFVTMVYSYIYHNFGRDHLCGLVVRVPGYRSRGPGSILGNTRFFEQWVWNGVYLAS